MNYLAELVKAVINPEIFVKNNLALADINISEKEHELLKPGDIIVHNPNFYDRLVTEGLFQMKGLSLPLGETYMEGWWDSTDLREFFVKVLGNKIDRNTPDPGKYYRYLKTKFQS